jgi:hypothetical protein
MTGRRPFDVWSDNTHVAELFRYLGQDCDSRAIDSIIIGNEYAY